ncbi:MAG: GGDEF domain-containing protein [bacterium]
MVKSKAKMTVSGKLYKSVMDNLYDGVYFVNRDRKITYWNKAAEKLTGFKNSEVIGKNCSDSVLIHTDKQGKSLCEGACPTKETIVSGRLCEEEMYIRHKEGHRVPVLTRISPVRDSRKQIVGAAGVFIDNSPKVVLEQRIENLRKSALIDNLTGIGNRRFAEMSLHSRMDELRRYGSSFGVLFMDIDDFKKVNDKYGHGIGDKILKMAAKTLSNGVRPFDIVCRWGGEEFIAIIVNVNKKQLYSAAERLRALVEQSFLSIGQDVIRVTVSIGGARVRPGDTIDALVKRADKLMYRSKAAGKNRVSV